MSGVENKASAGVGRAAVVSSSTVSPPASESSPSQADAFTMMNRTVDVMVDVRYPTAPIELYKLMFDSDFLVEFLTENQKVKDLEFDSWKEHSGLYSRDFHYTKPVTGVGPKEVYCQEHEENIHRDESSYIETETTTHTPNVTYGKSFHVITHTHIEWADNLRHEEGCILNVKLEIVWTGWCPFKGMVEGRIIDGQKQFSNDMDDAVRSELELMATGSLTSRKSQKPKPKPRMVHFDDSDSHISYSGEKHANMVETDTESWVERQSPRPNTHRNNLSLAFLAIIFSILLTLIVFRIYLI